MDAEVKINVGRYVAEMEQVLSAKDDTSACRQAIGILERWQFDEMLDDASRQRASELVSRFGRNDWNGTSGVEEEMECPNASRSS